MVAIVGLAFIIAITVPVAAWLGRREVMDRGPIPWDLADMSRRQITLLSGQAAVAITATVLLVTLVRDEAALSSPSFDALLLMFLIAFLSFIGVAVQIIFLPLENGVEGSLLPRLLSTIAGLQVYRTLFLAWLALKPLVGTFGLDEAGDLLGWLLGAAALTGWLITSSISYRMGVLRRTEAFGLPAVGVAAAVVYAATLAEGSPNPEAAESVLALTLAIFILNAANIVIQALVPAFRREISAWRWAEQSARIYVMADFQASVVTLTLLWAFLMQL